MRYLTARFISSLAVQMLVVAVGYQVYAVTGSALDLGLIGLSQFLPFIVLALPAGHVADVVDRRRILAITLGLLVVVAVGLAAVAASRPTDATPVLLLMALFGAARAFSAPASQSILVNLVPAGEFGNAVALSSSTYQVATVVGPALGGVLLLAGTTTVYGVVAAMLALSTVLVAVLRSGGREADAVAEPMSARSLFSGIGFVRSRPIVLGSISLDMFAVLFGGATALLPIYAADILHVGPDGLGLLRAGPAVGATVVGALLATRSLDHRLGAWLFGGVAGFGVATVVFAVSTAFFVSLLALVVMGAADMVSVYVRHSLVQLVTPDAIRGRVSAVNAVFINASNELGEFESGLTASWWGAAAAATVGGVAVIGVAVVWAVAFPMLRRLDRFPEPGSSAPEPGAAAK